MNFFKPHNALSVASFFNLITISLFLLPNKTFASSKNLISKESKISESAVVIPWAFIEDQFIKEKTFEGHQTLGAFATTVQGISVSLPPLQLQYKTTIRPVLTRENETFFETRNLDLKIQAEAFKVEKDLVQFVNGIQVVAHLKAECDPFLITQPLAQVSTVWQMISQDTHLNGKLQKIDLGWSQPWAIESLNCRGPAGFADVVAQEVRNALVQSDSLNAAIKPFLEKAANEKIESLLAGLRKNNSVPIPSSGQSLLVQFSGVEYLNDKGLVFKAWVQTDPKNPVIDLSSAMVIPLEESNELFAQVGSDPTLLLNQKSLVDLFEQVGARQTVTTEMNQISGFQSLLRSWFKRIFVWPDLGKYSKQSKFQLKSKMVGLPSLQFNSNQSLDFNGVIDSGVYADRAGRNWRSVEATSRFKTTAHFMVDAGKLTLKFKNQSLSIQTGFNQDYVARFNPSTKFSKSIIQKSIQQSPLFQGAQWNLPDLVLDKDAVYRAKNMVRGSAKHFLVPFMKVQAESDRR